MYYNSVSIKIARELVKKRDGKKTEKIEKERIL